MRSRLGSATGAWLVARRAQGAARAAWRRPCRRVGPGRAWRRDSVRVRGWDCDGHHALWPAPRDRGRHRAPLAGQGLPGASRGSARCLLGVSPCPLRPGLRPRRRATRDGGRRWRRCLVLEPGQRLVDSGRRGFRLGFRVGRPRCGLETLGRRHGGSGNGRRPACADLAPDGRAAQRRRSRQRCRRGWRRPLVRCAANLRRRRRLESHLGRWWRHAACFVGP
mmetsp:Transcript_117940/g.333580  ORF Transcript_117940/g.333580 Transcript_117940/m.333580 type:complete len:222 (-) Transcript_117940:194-859(-)